VLTQRYRAYVLTDERLPQFEERGAGGFVVMPDGKVAAVANYMHWRAFNRLFGSGDYHAAFRQGAIRVSFCGKDHEFWIETDEQYVSVNALRSLRRLASYFNKKGRTVFDLRRTAEKASLKDLYGWISKTLLTRAKAERTKQQEEAV
jgi:hypothetical protein